MGKKSESACVTLRFEGDVKVSQPHPPLYRKVELMMGFCHKWQVCGKC